MVQQRIAKKTKFKVPDLSDHVVQLQYGQVKPGLTPHINWDIVDIDYLINESRPVTGIETKHSVIDNLNLSYKKEIFENNLAVAVAVFYEMSSNNINFVDLYKNFIKVSKLVMSSEKIHKI